MDDRRMSRRSSSASRAIRRGGAMAGAVGVAAFVTGWILGGARRPGYSPVHQAISQLARYGTPQRALMQTAFLAFGVGVTLLGLALARTWGHLLLGALVTSSGLATAAVAAFPLSAEGGGSEDARHATAAAIGYVTLALAPLAGRRAVGLPRLSCALAAITAVALALSVVAHPTGLWQRIGLTTGDCWLLLAAFGLYARPRPGGAYPTHAREHRWPNGS